MAVLCLLSQHRVPLSEGSTAHLRIQDDHDGRVLAPRVVVVQTNHGRLRSVSHTHKQTVFVTIIKMEYIVNGGIIFVSPPS